MFRQFINRLFSSTAFAAVAATETLPLRHLSWKQAPVQRVRIHGNGRKRLQRTTLPPFFSPRVSSVSEHVPLTEKSADLRMKQIMKQRKLLKPCHYEETVKLDSTIVSAVPERPVLSKATYTVLRLLQQASKENSSSPKYAGDRQLYARVEIMGQSFDVSAGDVIEIHRLKGTNVGDIISLDRVRRLGSRDFVWEAPRLSSTEGVKIQLHDALSDAPVTMIQPSQAGGAAGGYHSNRVLHPDLINVQAIVAEHTRGMKIAAHQPFRRKGPRRNRTIKPAITRLLIQRVSINTNILDRALIC